MDKLRWFLLRLIGQAGTTDGYRWHRYWPDPCGAHDCIGCQFYERAFDEQPCNECFHSEDHCYFQRRRG